MQDTEKQNLRQPKLRPILSNILLFAFFLRFFVKFSIELLFIVLRIKKKAQIEF